MVFLSRCTRRFDRLAICTMTALFVAIQWQTVRAITNLWNALGTSHEWTSSAVTMRGSINAVVVAAGALTVSTKCCHFM